jgi:hypothetical protein
MKERTKPEQEDRERTDWLTELMRSSARELIAAALNTEVNELVASYAEQRDEQARAVVVRNGHHPARDIQTGIGPVTVQVPKVRSRQGQPVTFRSALVPPYVRKTARLEAAIPWLYLKGISTGEMQPALEALLGPEAQGLSASTVARLKQVWRDEYEAWHQRRVDAEQWVYIWVDGIYSGLRAEQHRLCALVVIGMNAQGQKHFLASPTWLATLSYLVLIPVAVLVGTEISINPWAQGAVAGCAVIVWMVLDRMIKRSLGEYRVRKLLVRSGRQWRLFCGEWEGHEEADLSWLDHPSEQDAS